MRSPGLPNARDCVDAGRGIGPPMKKLPPLTSRTSMESSDEDDAIWHEALSALGLFGAVLLLVLVISLVGRL